MAAHGAAAARPCAARITLQPSPSPSPCIQVDSTRPSPRRCSRSIVPAVPRIFPPVSLIRAHEPVLRPPQGPGSYKRYLAMELYCCCLCHRHVTSLAAPNHSASSHQPTAATSLHPNQSIHRRLSTPAQPAPGLPHHQASCRDRETRHRCRRMALPRAICSTQQSILLSPSASLAAAVAPCPPNQRSSS